MDDSGPESVDEHSSTEVLRGDSDRRRNHKVIILIVVVALIVITTAITVPLVLINAKKSAAVRIRRMQVERATEIVKKEMPYNAFDLDALNFPDEEEEEVKKASPPSTPSLPKKEKLEAEPKLFRAVIREKKKRLERLKPRMDIVYLLRAEIKDRKMRFIDGDFQTCLESGWTKTCMHNGEVQGILAIELETLAKILEPFKDDFNVKFELDVLILFKKYCNRYNVDYDQSTMERYLSMFRKEVIEMERYNKKVGTGMKKGYYMRLVENVPFEPTKDLGYSDLQNEIASGEFKHTPLLFDAKDDPQRATFDWREGGYVSKIDHEKREKSNTGWMLAAAAMYDTFVAITENRKSIHSAQQLWDCTSKFDDEKGEGDLKATLEYLKDHKLFLEANYKFTGKKGKCYDDKYTGYPTVKNVIKIEHAKAEEQIKGGPFITVFDASEDFYKNYKDGIYEKDLSTGKKVAALVVGYGTDTNKKKYWIAQPAWNVGPDWGEDGFFRIEYEIAKKGKIFDNAYRLSASVSPVSGP